MVSVVIAEKYTSARHIKSVDYLKVDQVILVLQQFVVSLVGKIHLIAVI